MPDYCVRKRSLGPGPSELRPYDPDPHYPSVGQGVQSGWMAAVASLPATPIVLAIDGPAILEWDGALRGLSEAIAKRHTRVHPFDLRTRMAPWTEILRRTASSMLADDPVFARLAEGSLEDLFDTLPRPARPAEGVLVVFGPGAALVDHDVLWYADLPKRHAEAAVSAGTGRNLGQPARSGPGTSRRLFYIDWPVLDRHRDTIAPVIDRWIDTQDPDKPVSLDGVSLRDTLAMLAGQPLRTRPTFNSTPWGGHWAQRELGINLDAANTALGYELIAPESGVLIGQDGEPMVEVPFQLLVSLHPQRLLGERVHAVFGTSFPLRFDYLDTVDGDNLSVHCHPLADYMRSVFGWPFTQHETYYMMVGGQGGKVFLGLNGDVDLDGFLREARHAERGGQHFDVERFVQTFPAEQHRLFLIPAGTPHASSAGNVVLEVSATPYLYSLRFYDWLRRDKLGKQRPVHVEHAFRNLNTERTGSAVAHDLMQVPQSLREGYGWREELLGSLPEMFFEVRRMVIDSNCSADDDASTGFHILNVVDGGGILITTHGGLQHSLAYAETLVVPASVGAYTLRSIGEAQVRVVKAVVR